MIERKIDLLSRLPIGFKEHSIFLEVKYIVIDRPLQEFFETAHQRSYIYNLISTSKKIIISSLNHHYSSSSSHYSEDSSSES
jgi:hypothetical protein